MFFFLFLLLACPVISVSSLVTQFSPLCKVSVQHLSHRHSRTMKRSAFAKECVYTLVSIQHYGSIKDPVVRGSSLSFYTNPLTLDYTLRGFVFDSFSVPCYSIKFLIVYIFQPKRIIQKSYLLIIKDLT